VDVVQHCERVEVWLMSRHFNREFAHPAIRRAQDWTSVIERLEQVKALPAPEGQVLLGGK
jgi:hypothetical protein